MHATTATYLATSHHRDLEVEADRAHLAAELHTHEPDGHRPTRWGIQLPRHLPRLRRGPAAGTAAA
jgi:hypothetical protein